MIYAEHKQLNLPAIDQEILAFWERENIFARSIEERDPANAFVFYEGPPSANGLPGIHHVMARTIKDIFCRYQTLQGKRVERKGGWDTHGLPIELKVESELGITKEDIGVKISVDEYNRACRETVMRYKDVWDDVTRKMGYWVDLENPYITYENEYMESVWWLLKRIYDKGLMYKGYTIQPYSPAAGTGLSSHELNMPGAYQDVTDTTVVAMFKTQRDTASEWLFTLPVAPPAAEEDGGAAAGAMGSPDSKEVHIIAWTTTPWTLPSNTALTVGPDIAYVKVRTRNAYTGAPNDVVLAAALVGNWFGGHNQPTVEAISAPFPGSQLAGIRYDQLLAGPTPTDGDAFRVITGAFVTTDAGTGIVHTAPSFGQDDMAVGKANGIGSLTLVDKQGKFTDEAGAFAGRYVKNYKDESDYVDVNVDIAIHLKKAGLAFNVAKYNHSYPHCWRTDKPILYYPLDSWFIRSSSLRDRMAELNETINWQPESTGTGRFGKWLENLQDWNLSRSRYWGIPLPIWRSECGTEEICIGSVAELAAAIEVANAELGLAQSVPADLHRPYIDEIVLWQNGKKLVRELDLIDVWFDSGAMPYAQWHFPFENEEKFARAFPADFIAEGVDQTRGWFYTLHAIATMAFDSVAFKNVVSNGLVLDKDGKKMSKRLGNAVDPFQTIANYGADATRWYMISNANPWDNLRFNEEGIQEVRRVFFGTLFNTYGFFALYANIDGYDPLQDQPVEHQDLAEIDRWIISRLNSLTHEVSALYAAYDATPACRAIDNFVNAELSNWYVRQCRRRFWRGEMTTDKRAAYQTLHTCLLRVAQLMSPVAPFFADWLYRNLTGAAAGSKQGKGTADSVHLSLLPPADPALIDQDLEVRMDYAQRLSSLTLSLRKAENLRVRQPLQKILVPALTEDFRRHIAAVADIVKSEVNIKAVEFLTDGNFLRKSIKPDFRTLGKRLGKQMKDAATVISAMTAEDIATLEHSGAFVFTLGSEEVAITLDDVTISTEDIPGWKVATDGELTVALDVTVTPELAREGIARELVNRIQNLRKDQGFEVTDRIRVRLAGTPAVLEAATAFEAYLAGEVLADQLECTTDLPGESLELPGGETVVLVVEKV
ncbi:isoleucine--tRNA ligase [Neolewinella lacunae]|uniref:Isoleucine--tRNA ligase n=1 Tax=Neolewinella lacunae TaxID=1517758 RepID=A0A923TEN8_9BACT|nr:isoleucine--tRNA ligase [Neolewinella lacunae]MBC6996117.1 isoleucine--tRNA ligase [Neolewinella lacunae]MDN3633970.1 isoleucine--tRNA ligase [Neolewinella lacunae]